MNKKDIIIIGSYANTPEKVDMLNECIDRVRPLGYDIMLVSHYPIPFEIQEKVDYFIYDKENVKQSGESTPNFYLHCESFSLSTYGDKNSGGHALAVVKNINNGINYANYLNYKFFFYMESDNLIDEKDLPRIDVLKNSMLSKSKYLVLFYHDVEGCPVYETLMFGGSPTYFMEKINLPTNDNEFLEEKTSLERFFYKYFSNLEKSFYIIKSTSRDYFSSSNINKQTFDCVVKVVGSNDFPYLYLFIKNYSQNILNFRINDGEVQELGFCGYHVRKIYDENQSSVSINVKLISDGIEQTENFDINSNNKFGYLKKGFIHFN